MAPEPPTVRAAQLVPLNRHKVLCPGPVSEAITSVISCKAMSRLVSGSVAFLKMPRIKRVISPRFAQSAGGRNALGLMLAPHRPDRTRAKSGPGPAC